MPGTAADLAWAQSLDETHNILCRHSLAGGDARSTGQTPLIAWRGRVTESFSRLLAEGGWLAPGRLPAYLLGRLNAGKIPLPQRIMVAGLESPAPAEDAFLAAVARRTRVERLLVRGDPGAVTAAVVLPDRSQELAWVAARLLESAAQDGLPLHRLAVTALDLEHYGPQLQRVLAELLGPAQGPDGWAYNFSQGPHLAETPLFLAATLPLKFVAAGEHKCDLVSLLLSPFYGALGRYRNQTAPWDRLFREGRIDQGWPRFHKAIARDSRVQGKDLLPRLDRLWKTLRASGSGRQWRERLERFWQELKFAPRDEAEGATWGRLNSLLQELDATLGTAPLESGDFLAWLEQGAKKVLLPGPGVQEAGLQVLGLLEMRGLEFSRVFCLGMNSGTFPPPPRSLPLLTAPERRAVLGGTYRSQHEFSRELYDSLLGAAPELVLTRPRVVDNEERVGSPLFLGPWQPQEMPVLSHAHPAWLRSPAVRAAFAGATPAFAGYGDGPTPRDLAPEFSLSQVATALGCPCRFLLEVILRLKDLPEIESGLDPRERGARLHQVLALFTAEFKDYLEQHGWDHERAQELLAATARQVLADLSGDIHWQAELERWLGETETGLSLLREWLRLEQGRYEQGWRWQLMEADFAGLRQEGWPFALRGRLDRLDYHPDSREVIVWDYKSGKVPKAAEVFDELQESQLAGYLLAVEAGLTAAPPEPEKLRAGYIGLKSPRKDHLKHEDFGKRAGEWPRVAAALVAQLQDLGRRLAAGDFRPNPSPAPAGKNEGACKYCPYNLLCGFTLNPPLEDGENEPD